MFVKDNSISSVEFFFQEKLVKKFSSNEIKLMTRAFVAERLKFEEEQYLMYRNDNVSESDLLYFKNVTDRLLKNEPFQHILGHTLFYDLKIKTNENALIPRPETEELVNWIIDDYKLKANLRIEDWCTGTGCIALALKKNLNSSSVVGYDVSPEALQLAQENVELNKVNLGLYLADALNIQVQNKKVDIIVSNPPYIPVSEKERMEENVLDFEPGLALFVENNEPLIFYDALGKYAMKTLNSGGVLYFELHEDYAFETEELMLKIGFSEVIIRKDLQGKNRMLKAIKLN